MVGCNAQAWSLYDSPESTLAAMMSLHVPSLTSYLTLLDSTGATKLQTLARAIERLSWNEVHTRSVDLH